MRWWLAMAMSAVFIVPNASATAEPCKPREARLLRHSVKVGQAKGKLSALRKKDGKSFSFNTSLAANHRSELRVRWPKGLTAQQVRSVVLDVVAKPLPRPETWLFELRNARTKKWIPLGKLSWKDGGGDKSFGLRTVDASYYRHARGGLRLRVRSNDVGDLRVDRLRLRLHCD